ncbi:MAG: hypothetical protein UU98_C0020G0006 [Parcubacteria group bacterium GW2011_GWD2_42_14]|nr:MAG: hypothetical protein UU98_C0020G0006 [Parcubacteria group bacterium GW2011_GWD2_42_14]
MLTFYTCEICRKKHTTPDSAQDCERQPVQPILAPETKVLYQDRVCRIGHRHFLNHAHERAYTVTTDARDNDDGINSSLGFVFESQFTRL